MPHAPEWLPDESFLHGYQRHPTADRSSGAGKPVAEGANGRSRAFGEGAAAVSVFAVGATMQDV
jgi:hypothetical protein